MNLLPKGIWPVMLTPFKENGNLDLDGLNRLTEFYLKGGANGLFANCLSSEMFELTAEERITITKTVVNSVNGKIPVVATGTFGKDLKENSEFIKKIFNTGVNAIIINSNQLNDENEDEGEFKMKLEELINTTGNIPLGVYECPVPYKRLLSPILMKWMADTNRFLYFKDTSCDIDNIEKKLQQIKNSTLGLYNANFPTSIESLKKGARGISPIGANYFPELYSYLYNNYENVDKAGEMKRLNSLLSVIDPLVHCCYPYSAKLFLQKRGFNINTFTRTEYEKPTSQDYIKLDDLMEVFISLAEEMEIELCNM